ncbi:discoidin domain-containing protein [Aquabacterium sp.]|uniref:discoidin domain-containing protein n=1 Tax=Aquabacterium sp. TaxID=1872578 RepID=UPI0025C44162|nr:discoidin domain-containing protein [Aquabacterium sp.]
MPFETGTANGHGDLMRRLRRFLRGQGTLGTPAYTGTGNGALRYLAASPAVVTETWTLTCTAAATNSGTFSVVGSVSGAKASATVGTAYDNGLISFRIDDGSTDFIVGDVWTIAVTQGALAAGRVVSFAGTGTGTLTPAAVYPGYQFEAWTIKCTAAATNSGTFSVVGSISGAQANATVGAHYDNGKLKFTLNDGATDFAVNDTFTLTSPIWDPLRWVPVAPLAGQPYLASSQDSTGTTPALAFDGIITGAVGWRTFSGQATPSWIQCHFDDAVEITDFRIRAWSTNPNRAPKDFTLQYSDDGLAWTTYYTVTGATAWGANESRTYTVSPTAEQKHAWWRINITANNGDATYTEINEIELRDTAAGPNLAISSQIPELIVKGPGAAGVDQVFVGLQRYALSTADWFNWRACAFIGYVSGNVFASQPGASPARGLPLWDQSIPYWFVANGRRFAVVAKVSTVYEALYGGLVLPYATPAQYPYPVMIGATLGTDSSTRWSDASAGHSAYTYSPGTLALRNVVGSWLSPDLHPTAPGASVGLYNYRPAPGDSYPLLPIELEDSGPNRYGYLDGVFFTPGYSAAVEDVVQVGGVDYLMVENVFRTGVRDFWALKLA